MRINLKNLMQVWRLGVLPFYFLLFTFGAHAQILAPGAPGKDAQWATAGKQGIGTSNTLESKVWFTLAQGVMTEVYYPDVTIANVHLLQFVVVNPKTRKVETERDDAIHQIKVTRPDSLSFQQINTAKSGAWKITKTYTTDAERASVLIDVKFEPKNPNLNLYVYYDPSLANTGMHDESYMPMSASMDDGASNKTKRSSLGIASEGKYVSRVLVSAETEEVTNGFFGVSDGLEQLREFGRIQTTYISAPKGNVVQMAKIVDPRQFTLILSFGENVGKATENANKSFDKGFAKCLAEYEKGWSDYIKTLRKVEPKYQNQFNMAAMVLRAQEDKTVRGANVASLTVPWGGGVNANEDVGGGYHLVWSRDLYHVFTAYLALGDTAAAGRALDFLFNIQQQPDGSFPQNSWLDGKRGWGSLQLDQVGYPLIMAYQLKRFDKKTYESHVKRAADFLVKTGPKTPQERWEEEAGYSPSTIAAEIAGLVCAAEIAKVNGDAAAAEIYLKTADEWAANIENWTVTRTGKLSKEPYYVRITQNGKPDAGEKIELNNGAGTFDERDIVDAGFLELVRLGIKSPDDPIIQNSVKVIDEVLRVSTPNGESFYRYNNDGYGEMDDGRRWNFDGKWTGKGRLWALLAGERGQFEIAECGTRNAEKDGSPRVSKGGNSCLSKAKNRLDSMHKFANEGLMIPEQIWDKAVIPKNIDRQFIPELKFGEGTGSATPLAWSMAQFIRLTVNLQAGKNLDTPDVVYNRYVLGKKNESSKNESLKKANERVEITTSCYSEWWDKNKEKVLSKSPTLIKCKDGSFLPVFVYSGRGENVEVVGDFTDWKPKKLYLTRYQPYAPIAGDFLEFSRFYALDVAPTARVEYKLIVDGEWMTDPLNPKKIDNGVGGENSYFEMPDYKPSVWDKGENPKFDTIEIESKIYGKRNIRVYAPKSEPSAVADGLIRKSERLSKKLNFIDTTLKPPATAGGSDLPVIYLQDGTDYINRAKAVQIQQSLVATGKIKPFIMVFLDPKDRMKEYWASATYAKFVAEEVVPAIDKQYKTVQSPDGRAIMGASLGGITSVYAALKYPQIFGRVGGQSVSWWIDDERVVKDLETLDAAQTKTKFYIDDGTLEGVADSRKAVEVLRKKGFDVVYAESEAGHNWTAWRDRLADAFLAIWK